MDGAVQDLPNLPVLCRKAMHSPGVTAKSVSMISETLPVGKGEWVGGSDSNPRDIKRSQGGGLIHPSLSNQQLFLPSGTWYPRGGVLERSSLKPFPPFTNSTPPYGCPASDSAASSPASAPVSRQLPPPTAGNSTRSMGFPVGVRVQKPENG